MIECRCSILLHKSEGGHNRVVDLNNLLTVLEAAEACNRAPETVRRWIREKKVSAIKLGLMWYIDAEDLKRFQQVSLLTGDGRRQTVH